MAGLFPVCRTADIPPAVIDYFLGQTFAYSNDLAGNEPSLVVVGGPQDLLTTATEAGLARDLPPSQFIGLSPAEVAQRLGEPANNCFIIMDERSIKDDTVLLVQRAYFDEEGNEIVIKDGELPVVKTVRATFVSAQATLIALEVGSLGIEELQFIAAESPDGVYGPKEIPEAGDGPQQGGEAPPLLLSNSVDQE